MVSLNRLKTSGVSILLTLVASVYSPGAVTASEATILEGPGAERWQALLRGQTAHTGDVIPNLANADGSALLILPNRILTDEELRRLRELPRETRVLAVGKSVYAEGGSTAADVLRVGHAYRYVPILYPIYIDFDADKYEEIARWSAREGAHGLAVFSYVYTLPERYGDEIYDRIRQVFRAFPGWQAKEALDDPKPPRIRETPLVLFLHLNDTRRVDPEGAVEWARKIGANVISVEVSRVRSRALYPGRFVYDGEVRYRGERRKPQNDLEYLPRLVELAGAAGIDVHPNIMIAHAPTEPGENELQLMASGKQASLPCPVGGARHYDDMAAIIEELLTLYPELPVVELDEPRIYSSGWKDWACFCDACAEVFGERYGYALKPENVIEYPGEEIGEQNVIEGHRTTGGRQSINDDFHEFRTWMMNKKILDKFRRAINRVRPETPMLMWSPVSYSAFGIEPAEAIMHGVNVLGPEFPRRAGPDRYLNHTDRFYPRSVNIIPVDSGTADPDEAPSVPIVRVDLFDDASVRRWGKASDGSRWPLLVSAREGRVLYTALDVTEPGTEFPSVMDEILEWVKEADHELSN